MPGSQRTGLRSWKEEKEKRGLARTECMPCTQDPAPWAAGSSEDPVVKDTSHLFRLVSSQLSGCRLPEAVFPSGLCDLQI